MSAISTYNGPRSAKERAAIAWGTAHGARLHEQEQRRHERLIQATRRIERTQAVSTASRYERGDRHYWRQAARAEGAVSGTCRTCLGKGWILSHPQAHIDDFIECPECTPVSTRTDYPTADDAVMEIPF